MLRITMHVRCYVDLSTEDSIIYEWMVRPFGAELAIPVSSKTFMGARRFDQIVETLDDCCKQRDEPNRSPDFGGPTICER